MNKSDIKALVAENQEAISFFHELAAKIEALTHVGLPPAFGLDKVYSALCEYINYDEEAMPFVYHLLDHIRPGICESMCDTFMQVQSDLFPEDIQEKVVQLKNDMLERAMLEFVTSALKIIDPESELPPMKMKPGEPVPPGHAVVSVREVMPGVLGIFQREVNEDGYLVPESFDDDDTDIDGE